VIREVPLSTLEIFRFLLLSGTATDKEQGDCNYADDFQIVVSHPMSRSTTPYFGVSPMLALVSRTPE